MKGILLLLICFFPLSPSLFAQIGLNDEKTDYMQANRNFQKMFFIESICGGTMGMKENNLVGLESAKKWYSCSDSVSQIFPESSVFKVVVLPWGPNCFGFQTEPKHLKAVSNLRIVAIFETELRIDSVMLHVSITTDEGFSSGFEELAIPLFRIESSNVKNAIDLSKIRQQKGKPLKGKITGINFQVRGIENQTFWGAIKFKEILVW
jgi:hypothetical protein